MKASLPPAPRWLATAALLCCAILAGAGAAEWLAGTVGLHDLDSAAATEIRDLRDRAAIAFTIAKTINAAVSVAKEITISGGVGVAGVDVSPGQILDPVDDLIEQFATAMLAVAASAQLIDIVLPVGVEWGLSAFLALGLMALALAAALRLVEVDGLARAFTRLGRALLISALIFRLGVPAATLATDVVASTFLDVRFEEAQEGIRSLAREADAVSREARDVRVDPETAGLFDRLFDSMSGSVSEFRSALELLRANFDQTFQDVVTLLVVFLLETLLLPLLFIWLAWRFFSSLVSRSVRIRDETSRPSD